VNCSTAWRASTWCTYRTKGSAAAQQDVIGGRVPLLFDILYSSMPYVRDGRLKVLGVASPKRIASSPDLPAIAETVPGFSGVSIMGIIAPSATPKDLLHRISADTRGCPRARRDRADGVSRHGAGRLDARGIRCTDPERNRQMGRIIRAANIRLE